MKYIVYSVLTVLMVVMIACEEETKSLNADFEINVKGEAPNAIITIENKSTSATEFHWEFSKGANISSDESENPSTITVDKSGEFQITLSVSNGAEDKFVTKTVIINGETAIEKFEDIKFGLETNGNYGRLFSLELKKTIKDQEVDEINGSKIDLVFEHDNNVLNFFDSPDKEDYNIPNALSTEVVNYFVEEQISVEEFDVLETETKLADLSIKTDNNAFSLSEAENKLILFKTASGKKGIIKIKSVSNEYILTDIKAQKYE